MSETRRVTSTARKISRAWLRRLLWIFFQLDVLILILAVACAGYYYEKSALGRAWSPDIQRRLSVPETHTHGNALLDRASDLLNSTYEFSAGPGSTVHTVSTRHVVELFAPFYGVLLAFELLFWLWQALMGRRTARRLLRPLDRMAAAARKLSDPAYVQASAQSAAREDARLHDLEDAISRISPEHPEDKLQMRDRDLQGLQDAINSLLERMHESYHQQAQFVSDASHELRTPIAVIQGYAGMLDRWGKQDEKVLDESIAAIKSEAEYMSKLVEQLLFLARGDTGRNRMEPEPLSLSALLTEVYEDSRLIDETHDWRIETRGDAACVGDPNMLKQCARILTDNARKYTPAGGVIALRAYTNGEGEACLEVQDSGIGIAGADIGHIFDRFFRSDPARTRESGGTGLGLSIAKWIVDAHGGHFEVLSRENLGTRMTVCLPGQAEKAEGAEGLRRAG